MSQRAIMGLVFFFFAAVLASFLTEWVSDNVIK